MPKAPEDMTLEDYNLVCDGMTCRSLASPFTCQAPQGLFHHLNFPMVPVETTDCNPSVHYLDVVKTTVWTSPWQTLRGSTRMPSSTRTCSFFLGHLAFAAKSRVIASSTWFWLSSLKAPTLSSSTSSFPKSASSLSWRILLLAIPIDHCSWTNRLWAAKSCSIACRTWGAHTSDALILGPRPLQ